MRTTRLPELPEDKRNGYYERPRPFCATAPQWLDSKLAVWCIAGSLALLATVVMLCVVVFCMYRIVKLNEENEAIDRIPVRRHFEQRRHFFDMKP